MPAFSRSSLRGAYKKGSKSSRSLASWHVGTGGPNISVARGERSFDEGKGFVSFRRCLERSPLDQTWNDSVDLRLTIYSSAIPHTDHIGGLSLRLSSIKGD